MVWVGREAVEAGRVGKPSRRGACQRLTARTNVPLSLWVRPLSLWVRRHADKTSADKTSRRQDVTPTRRHAVCDESIVLFNPALNCCVREAAKKAKATHGI